MTRCGRVEDEGLTGGGWNDEDVDDQRRVWGGWQECQGMAAGSIGCGRMMNISRRRRGGVDWLLKVVVMTVDKRWKSRETILIFASRITSDKVFYCH